MSQEPGGYKPLRPEELRELAGEELPERAAVTVTPVTVSGS